MKAPVQFLNLIPHYFIMAHIVTAQSVTRLGKGEIQTQIARCPSLPSLGSINKALQDLLLTDQRYTAQIAEIIRRDPSLTSRLLRLVNSVYYGLTTPVNSIEEAVFYLGVRQIRQLAMVTPVIEDFQRLTRQCKFPWREFWQHCIGTAILTREVTANVPGPTEDSDYVAGLVHDVGKIVMAWSFPDHFAEIHRQAIAGERALSEIEDEVLGLNHAELGALYLERHRLPELMIYAARYHHCPEKAPQFCHTIAAVQLADLLLRSSKIGASGDYVEVTRDTCYAAPVWKVLLARTPEAEQAIVKASLSRTLEQIPTMLEGMV
jgi:putative nucleotidyltransferase with HDIG domain